ncbi:hypothetical protein SDC9_206573 [bioreactor metagenome]|uniref:Uncharacterized protein n=1 Tax=bioreactor metagenome TaxID=1076179 RepID=A0A645J640_9ZZZZ
MASSICTRSLLASWPALAKAWRARISNFARSLPSRACAPAACSSLAESLPSAASLSSTAVAERMPAALDRSKSLPILAMASAALSPLCRSWSNLETRPRDSLLRSNWRLRASSIKALFLRRLSACTLAASSATRI